MIAILAAGCGESVVPGEPEGDEITTSVESSEATTSATTDQPPSTTPAVTGGGKKQQQKPGVPGSPITYDSSRTGLTPVDAQKDVEDQLAAKPGCEKNRCGIKVVIVGGKDCRIASISPNPVHRNKTVTILTQKCDSPGSSSSSSTTTTSRK
jgi:hypothetical protein